MGILGFNYVQQCMILYFCRAKKTCPGETQSPVFESDQQVKVENEMIYNNANDTFMEELRGNFGPEVVIFAMYRNPTADNLRTNGILRLNSVD